MKIGYKDFWLEIDTATATKVVVGNLIQKYNDYKKQKEYNKEKIYNIALVLEANSFVYQTGKVKLKLSNVENYLSNEFIAPLQRPLIRQIFKREYIIEESEEYGYDAVDYEKIKENSIVMFY